MPSSTRREFLGQSAAALGVAGVSAPLSARGRGPTDNPHLDYRLTGTADRGYAVQLEFDGKPVSAAPGEFDLFMQSGDRVDQAEIRSWRALQTHRDGDRLILRGRTRLEQFTTDLDVTICWERINDQVVKKTITLVQNDIPRLFVRLRTSITPAEAPGRYWSFDRIAHDGGPAYGTLTDDVFPAAGFVCPDGLVIGLLTESGWINKWSRPALRRTRHGNVTSVRVTDPALLSTATAAERTQGKHHVSLTLGESWPSAAVPFAHAARGYEFPGRTGCHYALAFEYQCRNKSQISLCDADGRSLWSERLPASGAWTSHVVRSAPVPQGATCYFRFGLDGDANPAVNVENVRLFEISPEPYPWRELLQSTEMTCTLYVYADRMLPTARNLRLKSQTHLAEGSGFQGTELEKVLYGDFRMLTWVVEPGVDQPILVPSTRYFEMYFRDAFWTLNGSNNRALNENILRRIGATIDDDGDPDNIITTWHGSIEHSNNEMAYLYLTWSLLNHRRFGIAPDMAKVRKVAAFIRRRFDPDGDGIVLVNNPQGCVDVMSQSRPARFAVSQGGYAVALRVAKELGIEIAEDYIRAAEAGYRGFYADYGPSGSFLHSFPDNTRGPGGTRIDFVDIADLEPEFMSLLLFGRKILTREMVLNTLAKFPVIRGCRPACCKVDGTFFSRESNPFEPGLYWRPGTYWNGGSWLRIEYQALAAARMHGLENAEQLMRNRLRAELDNDPDNPVSREYLSCNQDPLDSSEHRVFAWNLFLLRIHEWLGWRTPGQDPDFSPANGAVPGVHTGA